MPVCIFAFDALYADGEALVGNSLRERRARLKQVHTPASQFVCRSVFRFLLCLLVVTAPRSSRCTPQHLFVSRLCLKSESVQLYPPQHLRLSAVGHVTFHSSNETRY